VDLLYTLFTAAVVVVYAVKYKPSNFLCFSAIALVVTALTLWLENVLIASTTAVAVLMPELAWNFYCFVRLLVGRRMLDLCDYMSRPIGRCTCAARRCFASGVPIILAWLVYRLGYDRRRWRKAIGQSRR